VFAGGCTLDAAQAVAEAPLEVLEALVAKNVVVRVLTTNGEVRLTLLETIGGFVRERFSRRVDAGDVAQRHCDYYLALAERAKPELERSDPPALLAEFDREIHNLEAALKWTLDRQAALPALRLAAAVVEYWWCRGMSREVARWLGDALALPDDDVPASLRAEALAAYAFCLVQLGKIEAAEATARQALELARRIGDAAQSSAANNSLAAAAMADNRDEEAYRFATEAVRLARDADDEPKRLAALQTMAHTAPTLAETLALGEEVVAGNRRAGNPQRVAMLLAGLPYTVLLRGDVPAARRLVDEALRASAASGDAFSLSLTHCNDGLIALVTGDAARGAEAFVRALQVAKRDRYDEWSPHAIGGLAAVAAAQGRDELAAELRGAAEMTVTTNRLHPDVALQLDDRFFIPARERLGELRWREAYAVGAALTLAQAVDSALDAYHVASSDRI
jgi:tetratricopeptide (TPR) repeat protein